MTCYPRVIVQFYCHSFVWNGFFGSPESGFSKDLDIVVNVIVEFDFL